MTDETISFPLDPGAAALLTRLHAAGHAAYAVGGCVRDSLYCAYYIQPVNIYRASAIYQSP